MRDTGFISTNDIGECVVFPWEMLVTLGTLAEKDHFCKKKGHNAL